MWNLQLRNLRDSRSPHGFLHGHHYDPCGPENKYMIAVSETVRMKVGHIWIQIDRET